MIESFSLSGFRCFKQLKLKDLRRINIVVGDNGVGKTALGEALYLTTASSPAGAWWVRFTRGRIFPQSPQPFVWNREFFQLFWRDLFYNFDDNVPITASLVDSFKGKYSLRVFYDLRRSVPMPVATNVPTSPIAPLVFERTTPQKKKTYTSVALDEKGQPQFSGNPELIPLTAIIPSTISSNQTDMVNWYSTLSKENKEGPVVSALTSLFEQIEDVSLELDASLPSLFVSTKAVAQKQPLAIVSAGIGRTFYTLLGIASAPRGIVLVDEIENGIHYSRMSSIWATLLKSCEDNETQLFAATHSFECLQALLPVVEKYNHLVSLIRLEIDDKGNHIAKQFWGRELEAALRSQGEIR
jgi:hypothetical protein